MRRKDRLENRGWKTGHTFRPMRVITHSIPSESKEAYRIVFRADANLRSCRRPCSDLVNAEINSRIDNYYTFGRASCCRTFAGCNILLTCLFTGNVIHVGAKFLTTSPRLPPPHHDSQDTPSCRTCTRATFASREYCRGVVVAPSVNTGIYGTRSRGTIWPGGRAIFNARRRDGAINSPAVKRQYYTDLFTTYFFFQFFIRISFIESYRFVILCDYRYRYYYYYCI